MPHPVRRKTKIYFHLNLSSMTGRMAECVITFVTNRREREISLLHYRSPPHKGNFSAKSQDDSTVSNQRIQDKIVFKDQFTVTLRYFIIPDTHKTLLLPRFQPFLTSLVALTMQHLIH